MKRNIFCILFFIVGCGTSGSSDEGSPELLRVIHGATEFDDLEITVFQASSSSSSASSARYAEAKEDPISLTTDYAGVLDYFAIPEGDIEVQVRESDTVLPTLQLTPSIESGSVQTLLLTESSSVLTGTFITDDTLKTNEGQFRIRLVNAIGTDIDAYIGFPSASFSDASVFASAVAATGASSYQGIEEGEYNLYITRAGSSTVVAENENVILESGVRYSIVAFETEGGGQPYSLRVLRDR